MKYFTSEMSLCAMQEVIQNLDRMMRISYMLVIFLVSLNVARAPASAINPDTTLQCHVRDFSYHMSKPPIINERGDLVTCHGDVFVNSCWGRCDSSEIGDFKMPFKVSHHPVCTYAGQVRRTVTLANCAGYPDPTVEVFDATSCECRQCDSEFTSCENLNG